ncbi:MAG: hypothetical protein Kow0074_20330 [Candidatus Zixiibacteriota bacterium]
MGIRVGAIIGLAMLLILVACSGDQGIGPVTPDEPTAHEPWPDEEAENLAWLISGYTWAPRDLYERIRADLDTIRERWGDSIVFTYSDDYSVNVLKQCRHYSQWDPGDAWFEVEDSTYVRIKSGNYHAWDSLNQMFRATGGVDYAYAHVHSDDRVNPLRMIEAYERLPGIQFGWSPSALLRDPPNVFAYQFDWGIGYLFSYTLGGWPGGGGPHAYYYFRSTLKHIVYVGQYYNDSGDSPEPKWWDEAIQCLLLSALGDEEFRKRDTIPPARTSDLALIGDQLGSVVELSLTAPGNDGMAGQAQTYEFTWSTELFTDNSWPGTKTRVEAKPPGARVTITLDNLPADTINYIALRTVDGRGNYSGISNIVVSRNILLNGWTQYSSATSSLPPGSITALFVDRLGRTWAGTPNGAACLTNGHWQPFTTSQGLPSNYITAFGEDGFGNLYAGTTGGLARYDGGQWTAFVPAVPGGSVEIRCITGADDGSLWCGVGFAGAARFHGGRWTYIDSTNSGLRGSVVRDILVASNHDVWFATNEGVCQLDGDTWTVHTPVWGNNTNYATSLVEEPVGTIWAGTTTGHVAQFDGVNWTVTQLPSLNPHGHGLAEIHDVVATTRGDVWCDTYESLRWFVDGRVDTVIRLIDSNCGLIKRDIARLAAGPDNTLWIGTKTSGVYRWNLPEAGVGPVSLAGYP